MEQSKNLREILKNSDIVAAPGAYDALTAKIVVEKLKAAVDARTNENFLIIARTDAVATHGFDQAVERAHRYAEAGADVIFVEAPRTKEDMEKITRLIPEKPHLINLAPLTPNLGIDELKQMGFSIVIYPGVCLAAAIAACMEEVRRIAETGKQRDFQDLVGSFAELNNWLKSREYAGLEEKYRQDEAGKGYVQ